MQIKRPLGPTTAPRLLWMVARRLPIPIVHPLLRGLGRLGPIVRFGFAVADVLMAADTYFKAKKDPKLENIYSFTTSTVLASCSVIAAMNIPLISRMSAVATILVDFAKQSTLSLAEADSEPVAPGIANPTAGGALVITPEPALDALPTVPMTLEHQV